MTLSRDGLMWSVPEAFSPTKTSYSAAAAGAISNYGHLESMTPGSWEPATFDLAAHGTPRQGGGRCRLDAGLTRAGSIRQP